MAQIDNILAEALKVGASDIHVCAGIVPTVRLWGEIRPFGNYDVLPPEKSRQWLYEILTNKQKDDLERNLEIDISYFVEDLGRFRVSIHHEERGISASFRAVPSKSTCR